MISVRRAAHRPDLAMQYTEEALRDLLGARGEMLDNFDCVVLRTAEPSHAPYYTDNITCEYALGLSANNSRLHSPFLYIQTSPVWTACS